MCISLYYVCKKHAKKAKFSTSFQNDKINYTDICDVTSRDY